VSPIDVEQIDLAALTQSLAERVGPIGREGDLAGRTAFRDATVDALDCSELEAELIVDTLVARGFLVLRGETWTVRPTAS
jgi:hypothetical protein